jgi:glycosyltransferase involved in cell wall biosynthesis
MKIVHISQFAPGRSGLYEASRDMYRADVESGLDVSFLDTGIRAEDKIHYSVGHEDKRDDFTLITSNKEVLEDADILVLHTGVQEGIILPENKPQVWIMHGRPWASYKAEILNPTKKSYLAYTTLALQENVKKMVYFWPEYKPYWDVIVPEEKQVVFDYPPIDQNLYCPNGEKMIIRDEQKGKINGLICDACRDDIDIFETLNAAIAVSKITKDIKWHLIGVDSPIPPPMIVLINELNRLGTLGKLEVGRCKSMQEVYRSMDFLLTPHRITTRTIGEALSCGLPVIANKGCKTCNFSVDICNPNEVAEVIGNKLCSLNKNKSLKISKNFNINNFGKEMIDKVYKNL